MRRKEESSYIGKLIFFIYHLLGYYLPNDDGEFYQFCYVTHKGEIRGASTPFQFRAASPVEELLTMEDEGNSDMLVVTTKAGLLEVGVHSEAELILAGILRIFRLCKSIHEKSNAF